ncbi:DUF4352 domain-containing protein [Chloroflexia bacterium SDU3-3]|nr:DUF4352 domain-containing protein [Chloroflexia bacterium SDU3-3]
MSQPGSPLPPGPQKKALPGWALAMIAIFSGLIVLCVVAGVVGVFVMNALGSEVGNINPFKQLGGTAESAQPTQQAVDTASAQALGAPVSSGSLTLVVKSAAPAASADAELPPEEGSTYYSIQAEISNTSGEDVFFNGYDTYIQDAKGAIYKLSPFALASAGVQSAAVFQHIAAHSTTSITLDYEVPLDASGLYWVTQTQSATPAVVRLP